MESKTTLSSTITSMDVLYSDQGIADHMSNTISLHSLPPEIAKLVGKNPASPQLLAIYRETDVWKMTPVRRADSADNRANRTNRCIGIPTFEGYVFASPDKIIRCEGLQKCTKIFLMEKPTVVSSYNIGEFDKLLGDFGFFATHKSHLINLGCINRYNKDGTLVMCDDSVVPVARRRKKIFLQQFVHI